jgi:hypothetical protein
MEKTFHIPIGNDCMMLIDSSYWNLQENNGNIEIKALYKPNSLISMSIKVWYSDIYVRDKLRFIGNRIQSLKIIYQKPQIIATDTSNLLGIRKSVSLLYSIIDENKPILVFETTTPEDEYYREHISIKIKYQLNKYDANKSKRLLDSIKEVLPSIRKR